MTAHAGDCTIYRSLINGTLTDGICTCGYGWSCVRNCDWSEMYSSERLLEERARRADKKVRQLQREYEAAKSANDGGVRQPQPTETKTKGTK